MPSKLLDRIMFAQGERCFFCRKPLSKHEASVEHLVATAHGGGNNDENCVACCKAVNALFGRMSLKEKITVVLNQQGEFKCPNGAGSAKAVKQSKSTPKAPAGAESNKHRVDLVIANLKQRGSSRPRTLETLRSTVASLFPKALSEADLTALIQELLSTGNVAVAENKITYALCVDG